MEDAFVGEWSAAGHMGRTVSLSLKHSGESQSKDRGPISSAGSAGFLCNVSSTFASSRLGFWYGTISKICVLWGRAAKGRWSRRGLFFKDFRPLLTSVSAGEHASNQQVRGVPQTSSRMVAISSSRNFGRRIRLSGGQVSRHVKTRKVPCVVDMMPLLQVNQSLRI